MIVIGTPIMIYCNDFCSLATVAVNKISETGILIILSPIFRDIQNSGLHRIKTLFLSIFKLFFSSFVESLPLVLFIFFVVVWIFFHEHALLTGQLGDRKATS